MFNLDLLLCTVPAGYREDIVAEPQYVAVPGKGESQRWYGFDVGIPAKVWREWLVPYSRHLLDGPVTLFGHRLRCYGWFARVAPVAPIRSADQLVWLCFYDPVYQDAWLAKHNFTSPNNLTCAPGVREFLTTNHA